MSEDAATERRPMNQAEAAQALYSMENTMEMFLDTARVRTRLWGTDSARRYADHPSGGSARRAWFCGRLRSGVGGHGGTRRGRGRRWGRRRRAHFLAPGRGNRRFSRGRTRAGGRRSDEDCPGCAHRRRFHVRHADAHVQTEARFEGHGTGLEKICPKLQTPGWLASPAGGFVIRATY